MRDVKLLAGPKVDINQIRWPKAAEFNKDNIKNIVFDMEVIKHPFDDFKIHDFGPRGVGGPQGLDALRNIGLNADFLIQPKPELLADKFDVVFGKIREKWRLNQQFGRGVRVVDHMNVIDHVRPDGWDIQVFGGGIGVRQLKERKNPFIKYKDRDWLNHAIKVEHKFELDKVEFPKVHFGVGPFMRNDAIKSVVLGKRNPVQALKAFWKDAQGPKPGIGYGHPALKGVFRGREPRDHHTQGFKVDWNELDRPNRYDMGGMGGMFNPYATWIRPDPDPEQVKRDAEARAQRIKEREERDRLHDLKNARLKSIYIKLADDILSNINAPGVNIARRIAFYFSELAYYGDTYVGNFIGRNKLTDQGFKVLGEGAWSVAFLAPDGWVYKVNCNYSSPDGWFAYAVNSKLKGGCKHFPKIDKIERINKIYCARLELLEPLTHDEQEEFRSRNNGKMLAFKYSELSTIKREFDCSGDDAINLFEVVRDTKEEISGDYDIHPGNVMWRVVGDERTLVLTDPIATSNYCMNRFAEKLAA